MWRWFWLCCWLPLQAAEPIHLVSKHWPGYTNTDLSGGYFELVRLILPPSEVSLQLELTGFSRAISLVQKQQADLVLAVTAEDGQHLLLSARPIDADEVMMVSQAGFRLTAPLLQLTPAQLAELRLGWDQGYNYGAALGLSVTGYEVQDARQGLEMVHKGRLQLYLAEQSDLAVPAVQQLLQQLALQQQLLTQLPVYVGFSKSKRGHFLKNQWDQRVELLRQNGQLVQFYQRYPELVVN